MEPQPQVKPEDVFAHLTSFQHALAAHFDWLQRWYTAVVSPQDGTIPPAPEAAACPFDHWCARSAGLFSQFDGFGELKALHDEIHARAEEIAARAAEAKVTTSDYEALMQSLITFGAAAQTVEREAWKVLATVDPLTGLANRHSMRTQLMKERDRTIRLRQPCGIALVDIDHFKKINDSFGHAQGDKVLRAVANLLGAAVRPYDVVYRYGGEEFLLCLPGADLTTGVTVCERIRRDIEALAITTDDGRPIPVTATLGVSQMRVDLSVEDTVELADRALYDGKRNGRNRVVVAE
ncbi:MAG: diguanylate cyclase [Solirubrobacterales bacterium]